MPLRPSPKKKGRWRDAQDFGGGGGDNDDDSPDRAGEELVERLDDEPEE